MARIARIVLPHRPHLIAQRGNRSERVFYSVADRKRYLEILAHYLSEHGVKLWAYRLDPEQVLLVAVPRTGEGLARALRNAHGRYSQSVNRRQGTTGHLFHARFYSCPLDHEYLALAIRYLERFDGACPPETVSSAALHLSPKRAQADPDPPPGPSARRVWAGAAKVLSDDMPLKDTIRSWQAWLAQPLDPKALKHLLSRLRTGKPAGAPAFIRKAERLTGLNLSRGPGRPKKAKA